MNDRLFLVDGGECRLVISLSALAAFRTGFRTSFPSLQCRSIADRVLEWSTDSSQYADPAPVRTTNRACFVFLFAAECSLQAPGPFIQLLSHAR
jgi:hypothetical protein